MLAPDFKQAHRKPHHRADVAVPTHQTNTGMTAAPPRQLDSLHVRVAHIDALVEHPAHRISPHRFLEKLSSPRQAQRCLLSSNQTRSGFLIDLANWPSSGQIGESLAK